MVQQRCYRGSKGVKENKSSTSTSIPQQKSGFKHNQDLTLTVEHTRTHIGSGETSIVKTITAGSLWHRPLRDGACNS